MKGYVRQVMLRLVNHNIALCELYQQQLKSTSVDTALSEIFLTKVILDPALIRQYESLFDNNAELKIKQDTPLVAKIRALVTEYGWRAFVDALADYADQKRIATSLLGMRNTSETWKKIAARFDGTPRTVQV